MADSGFSFANAGAVLSRIASIQNDAQAALEKTADQWGVIHDRNIKDRAPVDTGLLKSRCHKEAQMVGPLRLDYWYGTDVSYAIFVEFCNDGRFAFMYPGLEDSKDEMRAVLERNLGGALSGKS